MKLVTIDKKEIKICSSMDETRFGKTNYDSIVTEKGILATSPVLEDGTFNFSLEDWSLSEIKSFEEPGRSERIVYYCGKSKLSSNARLLSEFDGEDFFKVGFAVVSLITQAAKENIKLPQISGDGIIVDLSKKEVSILILPENVFKYSAAPFSNEVFSKSLGFWINTTLHDLPFYSFMRGVICYKMLTGKFPYNSYDQTERNADIMDRKFLPIEYCVNGINSTLAQEINKSLKLNSNIVDIPGKKKTGKSNEDLTPVPDFPLELLRQSEKTITNSELSKEEFDEKAKLYLKSQNSKINLKRKIRRNSTTILISLAAIITLFIIIRSSVNSSLQKLTSKGLTSKEVVQLYFYAYNNLDSVLLDSISDGKSTREISDLVANVFVAGRSKQAYSSDRGIYPPGEWLWSAQNQDLYNTCGVYGITNLYINQNYTEINPPLVKKIEKPSAISIENEKEIQNQDTVSYTIEYFLISTINENLDIELYKVTGNMELTFKKDRWIVTDFQYEPVLLDFDSIAFKNTYFNNIIQNDYSTINAVKDMYKDYEWLPSEQTLLRDKEIYDKKNFNEFVELEKQLVQ